VASHSLRVRRNGVSTVFHRGRRKRHNRTPTADVRISEKVGSSSGRGRSTSVGSATGSLVGAAAAGEMGG